MPRKTTKSLERKVSPDRKYQSILVQRLINKSMLDGKKQAAEEKHPPYSRDRKRDSDV